MPSHGRTVRIPYAPSYVAWLRGNRMVAGVMCARHARNARRVRTPVRTWNPASSPGEGDRPLGRCPCGAAPWDTCSLGEEGVELSPGGAFADHLAHHRGRRSRPPLRRGGCSSLFPARDTFTGERGRDFRPHDSDRKRRVDRRLGRAERDRGARGNSSIPASKSNPLPAELFENRVRLRSRGRDLFRVFPGRVVLRVRDRAQQ